MWHCGDIIYTGLKYYYEAKVYDEPSELGINNGRVSKLLVRLETYGSEVQASYDRGWDIKPTTPEAKAVVDILLKRFK